MKRVAVIVLLAGAWPFGTATAADPPARNAGYLPTSPQVPPPPEGGAVVPASGLTRLRSGAGCGPACATPAVTPAGCGQPGCGDDGCSTRGACWDRFKTWLCFQPTTGKALPKLRPTPYEGPIAGSFRCTPTAGPGCAGGNGGPAGRCANGAGCADAGGAGHDKHGGLLGRRGEKPGCVPPGDEAFPGTTFARPESLAVVRRAGNEPVPAGTSVLEGPVVPGGMPVGAAGPITRPTVPPTGAGRVQPAGGNSAAKAVSVPPPIDPLTRPLTRP